MIYQKERLGLPPLESRVSSSVRSTALLAHAEKKKDLPCIFWYTNLKFSFFYFATLRSPSLSSRRYCREKKWRWVETISLFWSVRLSEEKTSCDLTEQTGVLLESSWWCGVTEASARQPHSARLAVSFVIERARERQWFSKGHTPRPNIQNIMSLLFCYPVSSASTLDYFLGFNLLVWLLLLLICDKIFFSCRNERMLHLNKCEMWADLRNTAGWGSCFIFTPGSMLPLFSFSLQTCIHLQAVIATVV